MRKKCNTIGILPSSYSDSLSYAEGIQYLTGQINNVVIPAVNNNGEIVQDIKEYYETHPIPTKVSQLQNDEGYITNEVDPTVPSYVKAITEADIRRWNQGGGSAVVVNEYSESTEDAYSCNYFNTNIDIINTDINNIESDIDDINTDIGNINSNMNTINSNLNNCKIITFNNEWRSGIKPNGGNLLIPVSVYNPSGKTPVLNLTSAQYFTGSQWLDLTAPSISYKSCNEIIISSNTAGIATGVWLVRMIGTLTCE